ncbi:MAG: hypothetical protein V8R91_21650 [Butyricimonas faecihominis]
MLNRRVEKDIHIILGQALNFGYEFIQGLKLTASISANYSEAVQIRFSPSFLRSKNNLSISVGQMEDDEFFKRKNY